MPLCRNNPTHPVKFLCTLLHIYQIRYAEVHRSKLSWIPQLHNDNAQAVSQYPGLGTTPHTPPQWHMYPEDIRMQSGCSSLPFVHIFHVCLTRRRSVHQGKHSSIPYPVFLPTLQFHFPVASPVQKCQIENSSHVQHKNSKLFFIIFTLTIITILLCIIATLDFMMDVYMRVKSMHRLWLSPRYQMTTGRIDAVPVDQAGTR